MKRFLVLGLALLLLGSALFADDAIVMPARVGRLYLAPSYITGSQSFNNDGDRVDTDAVTMLNLGAALEYGFTDWITGAVQWTPGYNIWSELDMDVPMNVDLKDMGDLFVGAKLQILGAAAPVRTNAFRLAFAPGVKIPLPGPDFEKQAVNMATGQDFTASKIDNHVLGAGLRSYFDIVLNNNFFLNLYNEFIYYPIKGDLKDAGLAQAATLAGVNAQLAAVGSSVSGEVDYGYDLTFEIEPVFTYDLSGGTRITAGLPVNFKTSPGASYSFSGSGPGGDQGVSTIEELLPDGDTSMLLIVKPGASIFFMGWALPMEFKLSYFAPIWGQNSPANHVFNFQWRLYFRI